MTKFHINNEDEMRPCTANKQACEFGDEVHFDNFKDAVTGLNDHLKKKHDEIPAVSKKVDGTFIVNNWEGQAVEFKAGERTDEAVNLLLNHQHLALAVEVAKKNGSNKVAMLIEQYDSEIQKQDENGDLVYGDDGEPVFEKNVTIFRSYAVGADGYSLWDVNGAASPSYVEQLIEDDVNGVPDGKLEYLTCEEAKETFGYFLPEQNYGFARTFVDGVQERGFRNTESRIGSF